MQEGSEENGTRGEREARKLDMEGKMALEIKLVTKKPG